MPDDQSQYRPATPLMEAILLEDEQESLRWVKELLESGENPNTKDLILCRTPLEAAWVEGRTDLIKLFLAHGCRVEFDAGMLDEVYIANAPIEASTLIFEAGLSFQVFLGTNQLNETMCITGSNPLTYFLEEELWGHIEQFKKYDLMCLLNAFEMLGLTPLAEMARDGNFEQAQWLLKQGADVNAFCEGLIGCTAIENAVESRDIPMIILLIDAGANPNIPTWMWNTCVDRVINFGPKKKRRHIPEKESDLVEIKRRILDASKKFPPPTYPDGSKPKVWPPEPKAK